MINFEGKKFVERNIKNVKRLKQMEETIKESGGLFYQYRSCSIDENTIYDIENFTHGVVYARSPLYMNDPFDSEIGFSTDKVIEDVVDMYLADYKAPDTVKSLMRFIINNKFLGNFADLVKGLNELKKELKIFLPDDLTQQQKNYIGHHLDAAIRKLPQNLQKIFNRKNKMVILFLLMQIKEIEITEQNVSELIFAQSQFEKIVADIDKIKETVFDETYKKFLSTINISCFTASGWKNALMWAHYANSYKGICVEYDFNKIKDFVGFIGQVDYKHPRPIISMKDLAVVKDGKFEMTEMSDETFWKLIKYLLVKDKVWDYENEWRIIDVQDEPNSSFIPLPYIKSITMGPKIDPLIKNWVVSICSDKNIDCYILKLSYETFEIDRIPIDVKNYTYDLEEELELINLFTQKLNDSTEKLNPLTDELRKANEEEKMDYNLLIKSLSRYEDIVISSYFLKIVVNRIVTKNKELLLPFEKKLKRTVKQFDEIVKQDQFATTLKERTLAFVIKGSINMRQKKTIDKKLDDIINVTKYYISREWALEGLN